MRTDFRATRAFFSLPEGIAYLDGNSLGPLPRHAPGRIARIMEAEWGERLIRAWNDCGWMEMPERVGDRLAPLIGAPRGTVTLGDTLSIRIFQTVAAAVMLRPGRPAILTDSGNFPSDIYVAQGLARLVDGGREVVRVAPEEVEAAIARLGERLAVVMLTEVDYRTGRRHDMAAITRAAHEVGALTVWDLAHSAGALKVDLTAAGADFAAGCSYKFLNGGPGAPAFVWVRPDLAEEVPAAIAGWLGHADPFAFEPDHRPAPGVRRLRIGTPPILGLAVLDAALDVWELAEIDEVEARAHGLAARFLAGVAARCPDLRPACPDEARDRGSQVSFRHPHGHAVMQALIDRGVIGDFRAPDILRFGITPLYVGEDEIDRAVATLAEVLDGRLWDCPAYRRRRAVT